MTNIILPNPFPGLAINVNAQVVAAPLPINQYKFKRAGKNGTLITMIIDESGSMHSAWNATIAGFNEFVQGQRSAEAAAGAGYLSLIKFDAPEIKTVYVNRPLNEENSSRSFTRDQIKDMVKAAEAADWTFTFLGANIDSFAVGSTFGMNLQNSVNYSTNNMGATMAAVSASTVRMRSAKSAGTSTLDLYATGLYTDEEKKNMTK